MKCIFVVPLCGILAACSSLFEDMSARSGLRVPNETGAFAMDWVWGAGSMDSSSGGVSFAVGVHEERVSAYAGLLPGTQVNPTPSSGSATMSGTYIVNVMEHIRTDTTGGVGSSSIYVGKGDTTIIIDEQQPNLIPEFTEIWDRAIGRGAFSASVDFDTGSFRGQSEDSASGPDLRVVGTLDADGNLKGSSSFLGILGNFGGVAGADEAIGAVSGHNERAVFSGGFVVSE